MKPKIILIEDEEIMRVSLEDALSTDGYSVHSYKRGIDGVNAFKSNEFSLVITDVRLPDITGFEILKAIIEVDESVPVIMMTAFGTIKDAVEAMKFGAFEYITKPFSLEEFLSIVKKSLDVKKHRDKDIRLKKESPDCYSYLNMIGQSTEIRKVYDLIEKVSQTDSTILILGENGTGKELVATSIHCQSKRKNEQLIKVNCAAIPENLIESELFGYEKGAFTGATRRKPGRFDLAHKGTIFIDEIGDLPASIQIKLLGVLQDSNFERLGGTETISVDVKVIAATNRKLWDDIKTGRFREDLYYRLNVIPVHMPALRERKDDIPLLIDHFLEHFNSSFDKSVTLHADAVRALMDYDFPGNVRELENIIERGVALAQDKIITREDLPSHLKKGPNQSPMAILSKVTAEAEKEHIIKILKSTGGNKTKAAEILGISRKTLWEKVKAFNSKV